MKDISKLFETIMDFKGLSCLVTEKSLIKNQRPVFFFATVTGHRPFGAAAQKRDGKGNFGKKNDQVVEPRHHVLPCEVEP